MIPETWATLVEVLFYSKIMDVTVDDHFITMIQNEENVVDVHLTPIRTYFIHICMPLRNNGLDTHADAYKLPEYPIDFQARFASLYTARLRTIGRVAGPYDHLSFDHPVNNVPFSFKRQHVKLLECLVTAGVKLHCPPDSVLEVGGAPGSWSSLLHVLFPSSHITTISPYSDDPLFMYEDSVMDLYCSNELRVLSAVSLEEFVADEAASGSRRRFSLVISDSALPTSWKDNQPFLQHVPLFGHVLKPGGTLIAKIPNILLRLRGDYFDSRVYV